jgi:hypothetical protein
MFELIVYTVLFYLSLGYFILGLFFAITDLAVSVYSKISFKTHWRVYIMFFLIFLVVWPFLLSAWTDNIIIIKEIREERKNVH